MPSRAVSAVCSVFLDGSRTLRLEETACCHATCSGEIPNERSRVLSLLQPYQYSPIRLTPTEHRADGQSMIGDDARFAFMAS